MASTIIGQDELIKRAGKDRYQHGVAAYEPARISEYNQKDGLVTGLVAGYQVSLRHNGSLVDGSCSCPESDGFDFCHHCVELVLHGNRLAQQLLSLSKGPEKSRVFAYLLGLDKQALAKQMLTLLEADQEQFERYLLRASLSSEHIDFTSLKSRITDVTRVEDKRNLFSQRQMKAFFARIDKLFAELELADLEAHQSDSLKLIEYAVLRLNQLLAQLDDKWGLSDTSKERLRRLFEMLFCHLEGRKSSIVRRFEKTYYQDRYLVLGAQAPKILHSFDGAEQLFHARAVELWAETHVALVKVPSSGASKSSLPALSQGWQWRKLAEQIVELPVPGYALKYRYDWIASLREFLIQSPMLWLEWLADVEAEFGAELALERAMFALTQSTSSEAVAYRAVDLAMRLQNETALQGLARRHATAVIDWFDGDITTDRSANSESAKAPQNESDKSEFVSGASSASMSHDFLLTLYRSVAAINPHDDPEERQYRALVQLTRLVEKHYDGDLALALSCDERILIDQRIRILKLIDSKDDIKKSVAVRAKLIPYLLSKQQNRSDDLAAEQTVLLRQNFESTQKTQEDFDRFIENLEPLIRQRSNFARLIEKHRRATSK